MRGARMLERALAAQFAGFAGAVVVTRIGATDWASVTFRGQRHHVRVSLDGPGAVGAAADFLDAMQDADLSAPGCLVADLALIAEERRDDGCRAALELEVLTIEA